jgi:hypothetical protein
MTGKKSAFGLSSEISNPAEKDENSIGRPINFKFAVAVFIFALLTRFYYLKHPNQVVFDEGSFCDKRSSFRRICQQVHQWGILHGCASSCI